MVEVTLEIRADTLAQIDALCEAGKPSEITRGRMLRILVQTGLDHCQPTSANQNATVPLVELTSAALPVVLLYGLALDDDDPGLGILLGVRSELNLIASLAACAQRGADFDVAELAPVLEGIGRRIEVALDLISRAKRTRTADESLADASTSALDGKLGGTGGST